MSGRRKTYLKNSRQARRFLSKVIDELYSGDIEESRASRLGYLINILLRAIEQSELEDRISRLEEIAKIDR